MKRYFVSIIALGCVVVAFAQKNYIKKADGIIVYPADKNIKAVQLNVVKSNILQVLSSANKSIIPDTSFTGTNWCDLYSNKMYKGGETIVAEAPISLFL